MQYLKLTIIVSFTLTIGYFHIGCDQRQPEDIMVEYLKSLCDVLIEYKDNPSQAGQEVRKVAQVYKETLMELTDYMREKTSSMNDGQKQDYLNQMLAKIRPSLSQLTRVGEAYIEVEGEQNEGKREVIQALKEAADIVEGLK